LTAELGVEMKAIPYIIKMADLKDAIVEGKIDDAKLKAAFEAVLKDIPSLKTGHRNHLQALKKLVVSQGTVGLVRQKIPFEKRWGSKTKKNRRIIKHGYCTCKKLHCPFG
jgi:hypothetical protein